MYTSIIKKIEKLFVFLVIYIVPIAVLATILLMFFAGLSPREVQESMARRGFDLLVILLAIKPVTIILKRYLPVSYWKLPDGLMYIIKGRTQDPILIYSRNLIFNTAYSLSLYGLRLRKRLGILTFRTILLHRLSLEMIRYQQGAPFLITSGNLLVWTGVIGLIALFVGFVTSNMFSMKKLKRRWKPIQQIAYLAFLGACIHLFFFSHSRRYIVLFVVFVIIKLLERKKVKPPVAVAQPSSQPVETAVPDTISAKVINHRHLTEEVLEFTIEVHQELKILPGQRVLFVYKDAEGTFNRAYSIADRDVDQGTTMMIFAVKYTGGRGTTLLSQVKIGDTLQIKGVFGHFVLQTTDVPKVFIGTGVGLAAVLNMAKHCDTKDKTLIYSVSYLKGLFYEDEIKKIHNLKSEIHITREDISGYTFGRLDVKQKKFPANAEFYICGNPAIVEQITQDLKTLGYQNIFSERF